MKLSDKSCKTAKAKESAYKLFDGGGLFLEVMPNGSKLWRLKYRYLGKEKRISLGAYRPYRGAGPSFKTDVDIGDVLEIEVGESENKKVLLMKASKIDHQPNASLTQGNIVRPTRPTGLIRRNPKLDATVYTNSSEMQMYYMINLMGEDVIHELRVNDEMDEYPYNQLYSLVAKAENNAALLGSRRYLLTVKVLPSFHAESNDPLCMIEYVRSQYINLFPELEAQDFAYIRRTYYGNNRYILCWSIVKGNRIIKLDGIRAATQSISQAVR